MADIIVIDDDEMVLQSLQIVLEEDGHAVSLAEDGSIGLNMIEQKPFDLVILDIFMPEKEGFEVLSEIKKNNALAKILMISGGGRGAEQDMYLTQAKLLGADAILAKPFSASVLRENINKLLESD